MNKFYFIIPIVLFAAFIGYYNKFSAELAYQAHVKAEQAAADERKKAEEKQAAIDKAAADAREREEAQRAKDAADEAARRAKWEASMRQEAEEKAKYQEEADRYSKEVDDLNAKLESLHNAHAQASGELFDLQKQIELAKIQRRDAELEIQRTYDMVTQKVSASTLANFTPPVKK